MLSDPTRLLLVLLVATHMGLAQPLTLSTRLSQFYKGGELAASHWESLSKRSEIPLVVDDSVAFLYRGSASSVKWMGDFNGWGYDKKFNTEGSKIPGTDIWILKTSFPPDARLDYKIVVDGQWILDPNNPAQQWSGVGGGSPNSELRMPQWKPEPSATFNAATPKGILKKDILINSKALGYQVTYSVYVPNLQGEQLKQLPVIYVTDGYEYLHEQLGNMPVILDNLIAAHKIQPVIAVFVDHREPVNRSNNRRMNELAMNAKFLQFFTNELIPGIESEYRVLRSNDSRAILGTSMGGLCAAYFSFSRPDVFGLAGIQSPAFWFKPEIYAVCDNPGNPPLKIYLTTGSINDAKEGAQKMKNILEKNTCTFQYKEVAQGHSWGNWKELIDDILIYFFPYK